MLGMRPGMSQVLSEQLALDPKHAGVLCLRQLASAREEMEGGKTNGEISVKMNKIANEKNIGLQMYGLDVIVDAWE